MSSPFDGVDLIGFDIDSLNLTTNHSSLMTGGATPKLPPLIRDTEDLLFYTLLMDHVSTGQPYELLAFDRDWLMSVYRRHREIPDALADDERGLVYALLCVARFVLIRSEMNNSPCDAAVFEGSAREDITYFRMALSRLDRWNRQSIIALREFEPLPC